MPIVPIPGAGPESPQGPPPEGVEPAKPGFEVLDEESDEAALRGGMLAAAGRAMIPLGVTFAALVLDLFVLPGGQTAEIGNADPMAEGQALHMVLMIFTAFIAVPCAAMHLSSDDSTKTDLFKGVLWAYFTIPILAAPFLWTGGIFTLVAAVGHVAYVKGPARFWTAMKYGTTTLAMNVITVVGGMHGTGQTLNYYLSTGLIAAILLVWIAHLGRRIDGV